ncbi:hypothetical protein RHMOL_Rhmol03G0031200 [Rhododendron molle]|uniref:Uncharacterized protein n=1 Tax=Rhododendron molle TaxID=49168 RepID=A0ACC0P9S1_RHOML|nr:hypothetical protein RHMOL_Rhmol03G0031200 [Rhododendron molle]
MVTDGWWVLCYQIGWAAAAGGGLICCGCWCGSGVGCSSVGWPVVVLWFADFVSQPWGWTGILEAMMSMIEGPEVNWLGNFFEEFRPWSPDCKIEASRTYCLVKLLWCSSACVEFSDTFFSIGRSWGEPITLDDYTSDQKKGILRITTEK